MALRPSWPRLAESVARAPVIRLGEYDYFVHPLTDGVIPITADLVEEALAALRSRLPPSFDVFLAPEAMGIPLATGLTLGTRRPTLVARKRPYGMPGEATVPYSTGYSRGAFHVVGLRAGDRVVIVDDVASTGGTLRALRRAIQTSGARLEKVLLLFNKGLDLAVFGRELGCPVEAVHEVRVRNGAVQVVA